MYAIVKCGGKQLKLQAGDVVNVERLEAEVGSTVELGPVLMVAEGDNITVGTPAIDKAKVAVTVLEQKRDKKVIVFKKKRRHNYRRTKGHRQSLTVVQVTEIAAGGKSVKADKIVKPKAQDQKPAAKAAKPAEKKAAPKAAAKPASKKPAAKKTAAKKPAAKKTAAKK